MEPSLILLFTNEDVVLLVALNFTSSEEEKLYHFCVNDLLMVGLFSNRFALKTLMHGL